MSWSWKRASNTNSSLWSGTITCSCAFGKIEHPHDGAASRRWTNTKRGNPTTSRIRIRCRTIRRMNRSGEFGWLNAARVILLNNSRAVAHFLGDPEQRPPLGGGSGTNDFPSAVRFRLVRTGAPSFSIRGAPRNRRRTEILFAMSAPLFRHTWFFETLALSTRTQGDRRANGDVEETFKNLYRKSASQRAYKNSPTGFEHW
jgi:hypothetical protein